MVKVLHEILASPWRLNSDVTLFPKFRRHRAKYIFEIVFRTLEAKIEFGKLKLRARF